MRALLFQLNTLGGLLDGRLLDVCGQFAGLDQLNVEVPREVRGAGETDLILTVDGVQSNAVRVRID